MPAPLNNPMGGIPAPEAVRQSQTNVHPALASNPPVVEQQVTPLEDEAVAQPNPTLEQTVTPTNEQQAEGETKPLVKAEEKPVEGVDVNFDDFLDAENEMPGVKAIKKPAAEVKVEVKPEVVAAASVVAPVLDANARDYTPFKTIFGEESVAEFKKMGNDAFNKLKPIVAKVIETEKLTKDQADEIKRLREGRVPDSYYEHEGAFTLSPEFAEASSLAFTAEQITGHWENQLNKIRAGEDSYQELTYNAQGQIALTGPIKITPQAEAKILRALSQTQNQAITLRAQLQNIQQTHVVRSQEAKTNLSNWEKQAFATFEKPEYAPMITDTIKAHLHPAFHANPLAKSWAKMFLAASALVKKVQSAPAVVTQQQATVTSNGQVATNRVAAADVRAAGPVASAHAGASVKKNRDDVTFDDFKNAENGL